ncbi:MAG: transcriptional regulator [Pseudomonadota bacterium]
MAANSSRSTKAATAVKPVKPALKVAKNEPATSLDKLIHERTRLAMISALAANEVMTFNDLKSLLQITDGNLSVHARKLEEAGYVECSKGYEGRLPRTEYRLSSSGRAALNRYVTHMEALLGAVKRSG